MTALAAVHAALGSGSAGGNGQCRRCEVGMVSLVVWRGLICDAVDAVQGTRFLLERQKKSEGSKDPLCFVSFPRERCALKRGLGVGR